MFVCPVCSLSKGISLNFERNGNAIYCCRSCNVEFQYPQPTNETLASIYDSTYFLGISGDPRAIERIEGLKRSTARLYLDAIVPLVRAKPASFLEIGCGWGDSLVEARSRGFEVQGLEYSEHAVQVANERLGNGSVRVGSLDTVRLPENAYDVIAAFDVIEHLRDPRYALDCLYRCLRPGGVVAIVTPSLDSWSHHLLGRYWMEYKTEHLTYFSPKSLRLALERSGFSEVTFRPNYKVLTAEYVFHHFQRYPVPAVTPALRLFRAMIPETFAHRSFRVVASGTMAFGRKRN